MKVEIAAEIGEINPVYILTKQLCRHTNVSIVNDKEETNIYKMRI